MTNKEFIQEEIYWLEDLLEQAKRDNRNAVIIELEEEIKQYNQVLKDLAILDILKEYLVIRKGNKTLPEEQRYVMYFKSIPIPKEIVFKVKEWLDNANNF